ncbi:GxxExxY protein [Alkalicella caledoniensis]|uniref:GxxExxY protein n=1 Tax=Alkalicella caledoniensis TaxID=2731377 RepID=A0A7G9W424_ALKCA|nr:GxxExxY protein [Alkalicella caledoniensis]QNO13436.1 GxxExxY protein [Alkalicella caledoniensis]
MLLFEKLTKEIKSAAIEVQNTLGTGLLEKTYEKALMYELELRGIKSESQVSIKNYYKGKEIGQYYADLLVEDKIIIELKCVTALKSEHFAQTIHYINSTHYVLGILINFGSKKLEFKRILKSDTNIRPSM